MLPAHAVCWTEVPVTDLDRSREFYGAVLKAPLAEMAMGPDMTYIFPNADVMAGVSGHIYKGKPAARGTGPTVHLVVPDTVEEAMERDRFMSAEEAKDWGLIDHVVDKRAGAADEEPKKDDPKKK